MAKSILQHVHKNLDSAAYYRRYAPMVYRRVRVFFDEQDSEELMQDIFIQAFEARTGYRGECEMSTWLYRLATNFCLNELRNRRRRKRLLTEKKDDLWYGSHDPGCQEARRALNEIWSMIPEELSTIAVYYHIDGLSHDAIAKMLGVSRRTIGNRLSELSRLIKGFQEGTTQGSCQRES